MDSRTPDESDLPQEIISLLSSSVNTRLDTLKRIQFAIENEDTNSNLDLLPRILSTYPRYQDRNSRKAVQRCLLAYLRAPDCSLVAYKTVSTFLSTELEKPAIAPTNAFVLLEWSCLLQQELSSQGSDYGSLVLQSTIWAASALEQCLRLWIRAGLRKTAVVIARRGITSILRSSSDPSRLGNIIATLISESPLHVRNIPYVGLLAGVCAHNHDLKPGMELGVKDVLKYYSIHVLGSKTPVPMHIAGGLRDLFLYFLSAGAIIEDVAPVLEKAILRSPEIVLQGPLVAFIDSIPVSIDLSQAVHARLLQPVIAALKSTNPDVREGAGYGLSLILPRCHDPVILPKIIEEILSSLRSVKNANSEVRSILAGALHTVNQEQGVSAIIVNGIALLATKENNEAALRAQVSALCFHLTKTLQGEPTATSSVLDSLVKACSDKRPPHRKIWLLGLASTLRGLQIPLCGQEPKKFVSSIMRQLQVAYEEIAASPMPAVQSGVVSVGYPLIALTETGSHQLEGLISTTDSFKLIEEALADRPKTSFLLNPKVYSRLTSEDDMRWAIYALMSVAPGLDRCDKDSAIAWAQAVLFIFTSAEFGHSIRTEAEESLSKIFLRYPELVGTSIVSGIWPWLRAFLSGEKESAAVLSKGGTSRLHNVLGRISPAKHVWQTNGLSFPTRVLEQQAVATFILSRPELIQNSDWITTCLREGLDPGLVVEQNRNDMLQQILSLFEAKPTATDTIIETAACSAAATLAFVNPDKMIPLLTAQIRDDLDGNQLTNIGATEIAIARTPEGIAFVDVLDQRVHPIHENKNIKDYDVLKWEEELRSQLAQKKGPQKKFTPDQQSKVDAQLLSEASTRQNVLGVARNVRRGAGLVHGLAVGPPTEIEKWMASAIIALHEILHAGAALLANDEIVSAYLSCSLQVSPRLGNLREFIGVATLRSIGNVQLPPGYEDEPLGDLTTRVLYRLRFSAEQRPFDTASLAYMLPLVFSVLEKGAVGYPPGEDADAQLLLALEFTSLHMSAFSNIYLPRVDLLKQLISSMRRYTQHHRLLKDALLEFCKAISSTLTIDERNILLESLALPELAVRAAALQAIHAEIDLSDMDCSHFLWLACFDEEDDNAEVAAAIWEENDFDIKADLVDTMPAFLNVRDRPTRVAAGKGLYEAVAANPATFESVLRRLTEDYYKLVQPPTPKRDRYGMSQKGDLRDRWESRSGLATAFKALAPAFSPAALVTFVSFLVEQGPLADRHATVRDEMVDAGITLVATRGQECLEDLMKLFEGSLDAPDRATKESDWVNEAVILLYGSLARHLPPGDDRARSVVSKLIATLSTPSESVQYAVTGCLSPLVRNFGTDVGSYITTLLDQLFLAKQYAARRGAAFGLAGVVRGKGVSALRQYRVMSALRGATENKKSMEHRQGALFAYELMSSTLGRTFEPYIVEVLPQLLACFGDPVAAVREACLDAAKTCFASLSSFGVHQVLPRLLEGLEETQWRSKKGACDLLGAMAYLDPQQLASSLPQIIPPLTAVLTDSHKEVRAAANSSLQRFGDVISNPEVKSLVGVLLKALSDPTKYTEDALDGLIKVSFIHYLDAPSLALVVRILERGLGDRSSTKRKAAQIIGSLAHLTERRDLATHLPILVSGLREASIDPVQTTRATASKALGSLVEKLGEDSFPDLIPSLMSSLRSDTGAGDRLGSAQALSEVLAGLGTSRLEDTLPTILQNVSSTRATVREGFMTLFIFLPACFGNSFASYLNQIVPSILGGLADEIESIRETALRAGRLLVKNFATRSLDLLLPELQRGLADDSYRIRLSSVELVGDLLFSLTGISSKVEAEDEDESAAQAGQSLLEVLGEERRNRVLSSLYICRCDTSGLVRSAAIAVWKALVATPRTLRELVPTLTQMIIVRLASSNMEHKVIAGNALGELIRKAGEGVFAALLPSLEEGLQTSTDADNRQGICIALREVVNAAQPESLEEHEKRLISIVRLALVDSDADVREAAAESFDALQHIFGKRAVDQVLPHLLALLRDQKEAENALSALLTLLTETTRANVILPNLIPTLLTNPITAFNARALASLAKVGTSSMTRRMPIMLNTLADNIVNCKDLDLQTELKAAFDAVLASVDEFDGLNTAMNVMLAMIKHDDHRKRAVAAAHLATFFSMSVVDYSRYNQDLIRVLLVSFDDRDQDVVRSAWSALSQLQTHLRKEEMESLVVSTRQVLLQVGVAGSTLPGFTLVKGILPVLQIFLQGLMNGTSDQRIQAALGISDIIDRSTADSLKPFVTQITGPLIRVVGERSVEVKTAILYTLNELLEKIPTFLRPFLPQLQRTFTKSIADPSSEVLRSRATKALSTLITLTPRVDPLIAELVTGAKTQDSGVRNAMLRGLHEVVSKAGANMNDMSRESILGLIDSQQDMQDDNMLVTNSRLLGALVKVLPTASATLLIKSRVITQPSTNASILTLNAVLLESPKSLTEQYLTETRTVVCQGISSKSTFLQQNAVLAGGKLLLASGVMGDAASAQQVLETLAGVIQPGGDIDTRRLALVVIRTVSRHYADAMHPYLMALTPPVFASVRDPVIPVKLAAEAAFLQLFSVVDSEGGVFDAYMAGDGKKLPTGTQRSMSDYFKRIALRLGHQARERREAEGGQGGLGLASDESEDEREVWSVGKVDLGNDGFVQE